jgi:GNAT superfamily N-acetyltransferase
MHNTYRLLPSEYGRYREHLLALDPESRYTRFGYPVTDELIHRLCDRIDANHQNHKIFVIEDEDLNVVAAGHIALEGGETELAFSVLREYRKQGMGSALMSRCIEWCQNRNIKGGSMVCLSTNIAIKRLAGKHGVLVNDGPESFAKITIPEPTPSSVMSEVVDSNLARVDHLGKLQRKYAKMITFPLLFK